MHELLQIFVGSAAWSAIPIQNARTKLDRIEKGGGRGRGLYDSSYEMSLVGLGPEDSCLYHIVHIQSPYSCIATCLAQGFFDR